MIEADDSFFEFLKLPKEFLVQKDLHCHKYCSKEKIIEKMWKDNPATAANLDGLEKEFFEETNNANILKLSIYEEILGNAPRALERIKSLQQAKCGFFCEGWKLRGK